MLLSCESVSPHSGSLSLCVRRARQKAKKNLDAYVNGKRQLFGFFIGQVMKTSGGRVNPELANSVMQALLTEYSEQQQQ